MKNSSTVAKTGSSHSVNASDVAAAARCSVLQLCRSLPLFPLIEGKNGQRVQQI